MFALLRIRFLICSLDLDVLSAQRIIDFFNLNYPQINKVRNFNHVEDIGIENDDKS